MALDCRFAPNRLSVSVHGRLIVLLMCAARRPQGLAAWRSWRLIVASPKPLKRFCSWPTHRARDARRFADPGVFTFNLGLACIKSNGNSSRKRKFVGRRFIPGTRLCAVQPSSFSFCAPPQIQLCSDNRIFFYRPLVGVAGGRKLSTRNLQEVGN
jgi:hypothetical protein